MSCLFDGHTNEDRDTIFFNRLLVLKYENSKKNS